MNLLPLEKLGARCTPDGVADFGVFFPWVSEANGNKISVKIIHEKDQFLQDIQPKVFKMEHSTDPEYGDYWSARVEIDSKFQTSSEIRMGDRREGMSTDIYWRGQIKSPLTGS